MFREAVVRRAGSAGRRRASPWLVDLAQRGRALLGGALALLILDAGLTGCEPARSYEKAIDGSTVYIDELSDAAKDDARRRIVQNLREGVAVYDVGVGDEIETFFHVNRKPTARPYVLSVDDLLRIEFLNDPDQARTVKIAPDGRILLPLVGPIMATGQTAETLARRVEQRYAGILTKPEITVNVVEAHSRLQDFLEVVGPPSKGRSLVNKVLPDGTLSLPLLPPIKARGRTLASIERDINAGYRGLGLDVVVSLVPRSVRPGTALVVGEVSKPGRIELDRPQTVLMAVAQAGGVTTAGAMSAVRVFYFDRDGLPRVRSINLRNVLGDLRIEEDMIVPPNSVVYVPPTELASAGRLMDAVVRDILRFNGFSFGFNYVIDNNSNINSNVPVLR